MKVRFIPASDTRENWLAKNPVALPGEICVEIDTGRWKFGDGSRPYSELPYATQDFTQEFFEIQKLAEEMQGVVDAGGGGLTEAEVIGLIGEYGTVGRDYFVKQIHDLVVGFLPFLMQEVITEKCLHALVQVDLLLAVHK